MSKQTFRIISGVTTAIAAAGVTIVNLFNISTGPIISGIIVTVAGCIDEVCTLFIKEKGE